MNKPIPSDGLQGEGNYEAARRHRKSTEAFVESGRVPEAAEQAEPKTPQEERAMEDAEREGRSHAAK